MSDFARRKEQELNESNGNNENLQAQIDSLKKKIRELEVCFSPPPGGGGYSIYPWMGRCGAAPHTLTLFKTNIADFPTCLRQNSDF